MKRYNISFESRPQYLFARITGHDLDKEIELDYLHDVVAMSHKLRYSRVMVEKEIPKTLPNDEILEIGDRFAAMDALDLMIAFVDPGPEDLSQSPFVALIGRNSGILAEAFTGEGAAELWLLHGQKL